MRKLLLWVACLPLSPAALAQKSEIDSVQAAGFNDLGSVVVPISSGSIKPNARLAIGALSGRKAALVEPMPGVNLGASFGTGFCLDQTCSYIVTNYHVVLAAKPEKIQGQEIIQRYFATGPSDREATANILPNSDVAAFSSARDLAILELRHPLSKHHSLGFSVEELEIGQDVDIYGYPERGLNPHRSLTRIPAKFAATTNSGLLAFTRDRSSQTALHIAGASGGVVVDRESQEVVGILSEADDSTAAAVPVQTLVEFVTTVLPFVAQKIFPHAKQIPPMAADLYPKYVPPRSAHLMRREEEPEDLQWLRRNAQALADSIRNFVAVQSYAWGTGTHEPDATAAYEVRVIDGDQWFRSYPEGKHEFRASDLPPPSRKAWVLPADEWSKLPNMVGAELKLRIRRAPDATVNGVNVRVFQYYASAEDNLCPFEPIEDFGLFTISKTVPVACYGEAWTDENTNVIRISERLDLSDNSKAYGGWREFGVVITYARLDRANDSVAMVPKTIFTEGRDKRHSYWCRGNFTNYRMFTVTTKISTE